ncbi:MAG: Abi family protein [Acholeplasma sp.]|jgi:abortive infection bacteriophage resistance protein|nr:Abi family protein [Acholeplasma sp.]
MEPLTLEGQVNRQIEKGCISTKKEIEAYLKTTSYYLINHNYEKYLFHDGKLAFFTVQDYKWLEETNEKISKEVLLLVLRCERIIRNKIADEYSYYCKDNGYAYFTINSFIVDVFDYPNIGTDEDRNAVKTAFIDECWTVYAKKKKNLDAKYHFSNIESVPPFVIAHYLTFGQIRTFFKLLNKDIKERIVNSFDLKISEFNNVVEKLNYLRNACAHGEFILDFDTLKGKKISNSKFHPYIYNPHFILNKNKVSLFATIAHCSYLLQDNITFFKSIMRNILEIAHYNKKGSVNVNSLLLSLGLSSDCKTVQSTFK